MRASAASETRNVAASIAYVAPRPEVAISTPASAGPTIWPALPRKPSSADAAASSSRGTSRGSIASSGGRWSPPAADIPAATTNSSHTCGSSSSALATQHQREDEQRRVGEQHEPAPVVRVGERPAEQRGDEQRDELGEPEQADSERRAREVVDLERDRDVGDHRARERDPCPA